MESTHKQDHRPTRFCAFQSTHEPRTHMPTYRTPGIYAEEISTLPPSVAEVESAIPAFIGYTEKATMAAPCDLLMKPTLIGSYTQFEQCFGGPEPLDIRVSVQPNAPVGVNPPTLKHNLAYNMKMFFANGGGKCYIVSVGTYANTVNFDALEKGLRKAGEEDEPTLVVIPDAVLLNVADYEKLIIAVLAQCGKLGDRFAIFDIYEGDKSPGELSADRTHCGTGNLKYSASYYPFLKTALNHLVNADESNVQVTEGTAQPVALGTMQATNTVTYKAVRMALNSCQVVLPPSAAVAGVYAATDARRGVWKAPANVCLTNVVEPVIVVDNTEQASLNIDATTGKSINAIRTFSGKGTMIWGARTLAGNDNEWRHIPVRRFFNMIGESVKKSTCWAVFEPNDANTWVKVRGMIENYLTQKWREGALAGATTKEAFFVRCGLGVTMNAQDILEGRMNVEIGMAAVRPAEFIILKFSHKLQAS